MRPIDADILRERLQDLAYDDWNQGIIKSFADACNEIIEIVEEQPAVNAVPVRHGKWLPKHHYIAGHEFVSGHICSECGDDAMNAEGDEFLTDYCPWCGARMDEE